MSEVEIKTNSPSKARNQPYSRVKTPTEVLAELLITVLRSPAVKQRILNFLFLNIAKQKVIFAIANMKGW